MALNIRGIINREGDMRQKRYIQKTVLFVLITSLLIAGCGQVPEKGETASTTELPAAAEVEPSETPMPAQEAKANFSCLPEIIPGETSREDVILIMGEPVSTENTEDGGEILYFTSAVEFIPNAVILKDGIVESASALNRDEAVILSNIQEKYGEAEEITYSYFSQGMLTYLYPKQGFSLIAEPEGGQVYWVECYVPMPLEDYLSGLGSALPMEDPYIR